MVNLQEKARAVFKGLDETDYAIMRYFGKKGPTTRYEAKRYFEGKPDYVVSRATLYRRIEVLKIKQFLKVVKIEKFKKGKLEEDVETLSAETIKGLYAVLASGVDPILVFEEPSEDVLFKSATTLSKQIENATVVLDSLAELKVDLTDKVGSVPDMMHFLNTAILTRRPEYIKKLMSQHGVPNDPKRALGDVTKMIQYLQKEHDENIGLFSPNVRSFRPKNPRKKKMWKLKKNRAG